MTEQKKQQTIEDLQLVLQISQARLNGLKDDTNILVQANLPANHVATSLNLSIDNVEHVSGIISKINKGLNFLASVDASSVEWLDVQNAMETNQD